MSTEEPGSNYERISIVCRVDDLQTEGFAKRRTLEKNERMMRALRTFGVCFGVAFLTLFIPILHFILPPLFLIIGGIFATTAWLETGEVGGGEIVCPNCKKQMELRKEAEDWPKTMRCEGCSYTLTLNRS